MKIIRYYNNRGGHGVSTVAAVAALHAARGGQRVLLAEIGEHSTQNAILGLPSSSEKSVVTAAENLDVTWVRVNADLVAIKLADYDLIVVDGGNHLGDAPNILVTKACYLSLRQAVSEDKPQAVVLHGEQGRALTARDIESVLGVPVIATVPSDPAVARAIDAGLLPMRAGSLVPLAEVGRTLEEVAPVA